jgi:hypothetical protein
VTGHPVHYFEDVVLETVLETPAMTVTETHVALYTGLTREAAEPGLVPESLPLCLCTGLGWRATQSPLSVRAFLGFEWAVRLPVRVGDTLHSRARPVVKRPMREGGVLVEERKIINQRGEVVQEGKFMYLIDRRPLEEATA